MGDYNWILAVETSIDLIFMYEIVLINVITVLYRNNTLSIHTSVVTNI